MPKSVITVALLLLLLISNTLSAADGQTIYLVRHAEKQSDGTRDPSLSKAGILRANNLAKQLTSKNIAAIYSTDYKRTRETAEPLAKKTGIKVTVYSARKLEALAQQLFKLGSNVLVVGHSQTTPKMVTLLGGDSGGAIGESEYGRLYKLEFTKEGVITELLMTHSE